MSAVRGRPSCCGLTSIQTKMSSLVLSEALRSLDSWSTSEGWEGREEGCGGHGDRNSSF